MIEATASKGALDDDASADRQPPCVGTCRCRTMRRRWRLRVDTGLALTLRRIDTVTFWYFYSGGRDSF